MSKPHIPENRFVDVDPAEITVFKHAVNEAARRKIRGGQIDMLKDAVIVRTDITATIIRKIVHQ